jgi:trk system potassium uptake protein TrkH
MFIFLFTDLRARRRPHLLGRTLDDSAVKKAANIITFNITLIFVSAVFISAIQPLPITDVIFEVFSAMGTVGMSTGITRLLLPLSKCMIIILMFCGRVGSVTLASAFLEKRAEPLITYPTEEIKLG